MSQENVEVWRSQIEEFRRSASEVDPEAAVSTMVEIWAPEMEWDMSEAEMPDIAGVYKGIEACRQLWQNWFATWETLQFEYELVDAGDRAVMLVDLRLRGRFSGVEVPFGKHAFVARFRDGLMVHAKLHMSQSEALKAAGLRE